MIPAAAFARSLARAAALSAVVLLASCDADLIDPPEAALQLGNTPGTPTSYTLKVAMKGRGEVKHTADAAGATSCSTLAPNPESVTCARTYAPNTVVTLQATAGPGYTFDHWGGPCSGTGTCTVTMNENRAVEAIFKAPVVTPTSYTLKVAMKGRGEVKHTADLAGATSCSTLSPNPESLACARTYAPNTVVTLQATAGPGYTFDHWGGPCSGTGTCTVTMSESRAVEAIFKAPVVAPTSYTLKILVRGRGEVKHTADLAGATSCVATQATSDKAECARTFAPGAEVTLEALPAAGYKLGAWSAPCPSAGTCALKMTENRVVEVKFQP